MNKWTNEQMNEATINWNCTVILWVIANCLSIDNPILAKTLAANIYN